jgi:hypothetical protein
VTTGDHRTRRIILRRPSGLADVRRFAEELGWPLAIEEEADEDRGKAHEIAWAAGPAVSLHYLDDPVSGCGYVVAWGADPKIAEGLAALAEERLDAWTPDELLLAAANATEPMERARSVIRVGLGSPDEFDARFLELIRNAMSHPDTRVREAALYATGYTAWPAYRPLLEDAARNDPDTSRRNDAQILLEAFEELGSSTSGQGPRR